MRRFVQLEMDEVLEGAHPRAHVRHGDGREPLHAEGLHCERAHRRAVHHGAAQVRGRHVVGRGEIGHEAPGEGIPRARGIEHLLERVGGDLEGGVVVHKQRAVLPLLDDGHLGTMREHPACRAVDVPVAGQLARFGVVHHQDVDVAQQLEQEIALRLDPIVHGIAGHERRMRDLVEDAELQLGVDVAEERVAGVAEGLR